MKPFTVQLYCMIGSRPSAVSWPGKVRPLCPVCPHQPPAQVVNDEFHLLTVCPAVAGLRRELGIELFLNLCHLEGLSQREAFVTYLAGQSPKGAALQQWEYLERGSALMKLRDVWFTKWL